MSLHLSYSLGVISPFSRKYLRGSLGSKQGYDSAASMVVVAGAVATLSYSDALKYSGFIKSSMQKSPLPSFKPSAVSVSWLSL